MSEERWVQHISGQGEKWEVESECVGYWIVDRGTPSVDTLLTKLDYILCDPPEVWRDVSGECEVPGDDRQCTITHKGTGFNTQNGYRFRKVEVNLIGPNYQYGCKKAWAFIVEQKVTK